MALKITRKNNVLWVTGRMFGHHIRRSTKLPIGYEREAEKIRLNIEAEIIEGRFGDKTKTRMFGDACDQYLKFKQAEQRLSADTNRKVERFRDIFGDTSICDMTPEMITDKTLSEFSGLKPNSIRRYLNILSAILRHAASVWEFTPPKIIRPHVDDARDHHFTAVQANSFLRWVAHEHKHYSPHFTILIDCGVRLGEMLRLFNEDFNEEDEYVYVKKQSLGGKTKVRQIPMTEQIKSTLPLLYKTGCVVRKINGEPFPDSNTASNYLGKILKQGCAELGLPQLRVHDLRHTFAFLVAQAGADIGDLQLLMGHDDISQTMRYRGFVPTRAKHALASLR